MPSARSAAGSAALTSPSPPALANGAHSGVAKRTRMARRPAGLARSGTAVLPLRPNACGLRTATLIGAPKSLRTGISRQAAPFSSRAPSARASTPLLLGRLHLDQAGDARRAAVVDQAERVHRTVGLAQRRAPPWSASRSRRASPSLSATSGFICEEMLLRGRRRAYPKTHEPAVVQPTTEISATLAAVRQVASVPATIDFIPRSTISGAPLRATWCPGRRS